MVEAIIYGLGYALLICAVIFLIDTIYMAITGKSKLGR